MEIEFLKKDKDEISFIIKGINNSLANAIRRSVSEIPILAVEYVEFFKNSSALYDEIIAHRLGLVPLEQDEALKRKEECECKGKGCSRCTVKLKLEEKGPKMVLAKDLKGPIKAIFGEMPLVWLDKDQEISANIICSLGIGLDHAKYTPGLVYFRGVPEIEVKGSCDNCNECISLCPEKALTLVNKKLKLDPIKCTACNYCVEQCKKEAIQIKVSKKDFIFVVESFGQLTPKQIFIKAIESLNRNLDLLAKKIK